jgi:hypothetical protein
VFKLNCMAFGIKSTVGYFTAEQVLGGDVLGGKAFGLERLDRDVDMRYHKEPATDVSFSSSVINIKKKVFILKVQFSRMPTSYFHLKVRWSQTMDALERNKYLRHQQKNGPLSVGRQSNSSFDMLHCDDSSTSAAIDRCFRIPTLWHLLDTDFS